MSRSLLSRRHLLKGTVGGAAVAVALPPLEAVLNRHGTAYADGEQIPKRFGTWFWAQGVKLDRWIPTAAGAAWRDNPPPSLKPLADRKLLDYVSVVTHMWMPFKVYAPPHFRNHDAIVTASPLKILSGPNADGNYQTETTGPSFVELIRQHLAGKTRFDEIKATVSRAWTATSSLNGGSVTSKEHSPEALYNHLFSAGLGSGTAVTTGVENARKSVLDAVALDAEDLRKRLGGSDVRRLDEHLAGIRAVEKLVTFVGKQSCSLPPRGTPRPPDEGMREPLEEVNTALADLAAYALACDLSRFFRLTFNRPQSNVIFWPVGVEREYHEWGHSEPNPQPQIQRCVEFIMKQLAYFVDRLRSIQIGARSLLDHTCLWAYSEVNEAMRHGMFNLPNLVIGRAGGALRSGIHHHAGGMSKDDPATRVAVPGAIQTRLYLTMMRALGMNQRALGAGDAYAEQSMPELETGA